MRSAATIPPALGATPMQVAFARLLHRAPDIPLIPGTSSVEHLRENLKAATLTPPSGSLAELDIIAGSKDRADGP